MNETQIAATLQAKLKADRTAPEQPPAKVESEPPRTDVNTPKPTTPDPLATYRLLDYFNVPNHDRDDPNVGEKITAIYKWATERTGTADQLDAMEAIRQLESRLGLTFRNDEKLGSLYQWILLDNQRRRIEKEMQYV
jgi:hypothetical protein